MIYETLHILKEQLESYFSEVGLDEKFSLDNIALWESGSENSARINDKVVISLLKIEEESTLKNTPSYKIKNDRTEYKNPPIHLNLYILISANCTLYANSLQSISTTIKFFQGKKIFTSANTVYNRTNVTFDVLDYFKFILELYTPTFEELNNIWGTLGGRQLPSVIYRIQLVHLEGDKKLSESTVITQVGGTLNDLRQ